MDKVTLIIKGTESIIPVEELTIERIIAEAHSVGFEEFSVFCNDKEIEKPDQFKVIAGAVYIIAAPEEDFDFDIIEEENEPD